MSQYPILAPAAVLILWSLFMLIWMMVTRFGAFSKAGINLSKAPPGGRGNRLEGVIPDKVNWKAHNYAHLMEQPTLFYGIVIILALTGTGTGFNLILAWGYTGLRVLHSLWQASVNTIPVRFGLFFLSTLCLIGLAIHGVIATI